MKKTFLILAVAAMCGAAQATILRVNNTTGSGAPYSDLNAAIEAASAGDTIMIDGSPISYGDVTISKKLVLMGPGYWKVENGISSEGASSAQLKKVTIEKPADGLVLRGIYISNVLTIKAPNVVINRCLLDYYITLNDNTASKCIIHQNWLKGIKGGQSSYPSYAQITNNIFVNGNYDETIYYLNEAYIAYNTFAFSYGSYADASSCTNCTFEKNIAKKFGTMSTCSLIDNYTYENTQYTNRNTDLTIKNQKIEDTDILAGVTGRGAFAGDDPYVISGIPAGPNIEDITVPATVEQGNTLNVTIKLGVQK